MEMVLELWQNGTLNPDCQNEAFVFTDPGDVSNCSGGWDNYAQQAANYTEAMGYFTILAEYPTAGDVQSQIANNHTTIFYEHCHGGVNYFRSECAPYAFIQAYEIEDWIEDYPKMPLTFLASCRAMCDTGENTH